ncbi:MAG: AI-2E family transporter [Synergistes sp.]|nr:AI-2E family transporter [Synergistes sp.]
MNQLSEKNYCGGVSFFIFCAVFVLLGLKVAAPIMTPILWAAMIAFTTAPIYRFIRERFLPNRFPSIAALLTLLLFLFIIFVPLIYAAASLAEDASALISQIYELISKVQMNNFSISDLKIKSWLPEPLANRLSEFLDNSESVQAALFNCAQGALSFLQSLSGSLIMQGSNFVINSVIVLIFSFFFVRDGEAIINFIKSIIPLSQEEGRAFFKNIGGSLNAIVYGVILTVALQALLGAACWWYVGLGKPALFGVLMFFFGMFPLGTAAVWVPGSIYLAVTGDYLNAAILFIFGSAVVGTVDNALRPMLISHGGGGEIPTLLILMGIFGGVAIWGFLGVFLGPMALILFVAVCKIYRDRKAEAMEQ